MPIFDGFLAVFSLAVGIFAGIGGRKAGVGVDACYQRFPAERLGLTSGCWLAGPWSKSTPLRSPASPCAIIDVFAHNKWRAQPRANGSGMTHPDYLKKVLTARVYDVARESELEPARNLSARLHNSVYLKREDNKPVFSFKIRGAYNKMVQLSADVLARGVITASAGNHAQGVVFGHAARLQGSH